MPLSSGIAQTFDLLASFVVGSMYAGCVSMDVQNIPTSLEVDTEKSLKQQTTQAEKTLQQCVGLTLVNKKNTYLVPSKYTYRKIKYLPPPHLLFADKIKQPQNMKTHTTLHNTTSLF